MADSTQTGAHPLYGWLLVAGLVAAAGVLLNDPGPGDESWRRQQADLAVKELLADGQRRLAAANRQQEDAAPTAANAIDIEGLVTITGQLLYGGSGRACYIGALAVQELLQQRQAGVPLATQLARIDALVRQPPLDLEAVIALRQATALAYGYDPATDAVQLQRDLVDGCAESFGSYAEVFGTMAGTEGSDDGGAI